MAQRVPFPCQNSGVTPIHLYAALADMGRLISGRTKAALSVRKASGGKLGNPTNLRQAGDLG